jgi:hypothetical protein
MIGYTQENTGFDINTTVPGIAGLAKRAVNIFPALQHLRVVRSWASLRILTADGLPIYDEIEGLPRLLCPHITQLCYPCLTALVSVTSNGFWGPGKPAQIDQFNLERFNVNV